MFGWSRASTVDKLVPPRYSNPEKPRLILVFNPLDFRYSIKCLISSIDFQCKVVPESSCLSKRFVPSYFLQ